MKFTVLKSRKFPDKWVVGGMLPYLYFRKEEDANMCKVALGCAYQAGQRDVQFGINKLLGRTV